MSSMLLQASIIYIFQIVLLWTCIPYILCQLIIWILMLTKITSWHTSYPSRRVNRTKHAGDFWWEFVKKKKKNCISCHSNNIITENSYRTQFLMQNILSFFFLFIFFFHDPDIFLWDSLKNLCVSNIPYFPDTFINAYHTVSD